MDLKLKKTALNDDAMIYKRSKDTITKEELKKLPFKQKLGYFKDYYLMKVIVVIIIFAMIFSVLNSAVFNRSECILAICFLNNSMVTQSDELSASLEDYIGPENDNDYVGTEYFYLDNPQSSMAFATRIAAQAVDIIICSYDDFLEQSESGMLFRLDEFLPADMYDALSDRILENKVASLDFEGNVTSYTEPFPFGIDLSDNKTYTDYGGREAHPVLAVAASAKNQENILRAITFFFSLQ